MKGRSIFISCTDEFVYLADHLREKLEADDWKVLWFHRDFDATEAESTRDTCLRNAAGSDFLVMLVGRRFGLSFDGGNRSFCEAEFEAARDAGKPVLVLVQRGVFVEAGAYHRKHKLGNGESPKSSDFKADLSSLELIERLQHPPTGSMHGIPWIEQFATCVEIADHIKHKWTQFLNDAANAALAETGGTPEQSLLFELSQSPPEVALPENASISLLQDYLERIYRDQTSSIGHARYAMLVARKGGLFTSDKQRSWARFPAVACEYIEALARAASSLKLELERCALDKFPQRCAYCFERTCKQTLKRPSRDDGKFMDQRNAREAERLREQSRRNGLPLQFTLDDWRQQICEIYPRNWDKGVAELVCRVQEEQSELIEAMTAVDQLGDSTRSGTSKTTDSSRKSMALAHAAEEFADLLSWSVVYAGAVLDSVAPASESPTTAARVSHLMWDRYRAGCPRCLRFRCSRTGKCRV